MRDFKTFISKEEFTRQKMDYIHNNPVATEIVGEPENYLYSSAKDYLTKERGYLAIDFIGCNSYFRMAFSTGTRYKRKP